MSQWWASRLYLSGTVSTSLRSTSAGVLPGARPVRLATRKMWVSTAMVGSPKATLRTTLAVLRPTPGRDSRSSRRRGTSPPCFSTSVRAMRMMFFDLVLNRPMVRMESRSRGSPSFSIFSGVSATANRRRVALLTPTSVACADSTTATSRVNGLR